MQASSYKEIIKISRLYFKPLAHLDHVIVWVVEEQLQAHKDAQWFRNLPYNMWGRSCKSICPPSDTVSDRLIFHARAFNMMLHDCIYYNPTQLNQSQPSAILLAQSGFWNSLCDDNIRIKYTQASTETLTRSGWPTDAGGHVWLKLYYSALCMHSWNFLWWKTSTSTISLTRVVGHDGEAFPKSFGMMGSPAVAYRCKAFWKSWLLSGMLCLYPRLLILDCAVHASNCDRRIIQCHWKLPAW